MQVTFSKIGLEISPFLQYDSFIVTLTRNVLQLQPTRNFKARTFRNVLTNLNGQAKTKMELLLGMVGKHACLCL